jgi:hypothetical protein
MYLFKKIYKNTSAFMYGIYLTFSGVLIANKIDLDQRRVISPKMGADFAASQGLKYFECSAVSSPF